MSPRIVLFQIRSRSPGSRHCRCSLAFGCKAISKLDQWDSRVRSVSAAVKRDAALREERRELPCLARNPTSATLTIQTTSKMTPTTSCSFLFVMEETAGLPWTARHAGTVRIDVAIGGPPVCWLTPLAPFYSPAAPGDWNNPEDLTFGRWGAVNGLLAEWDRIMRSNGRRSALEVLPPSGGAPDRNHRFCRSDTAVPWNASAMDTLDQHNPAPGQLAPGMPVGSLTN
jgi:hypothetical protein